jgi:hypothetical protein
MSKTTTLASGQITTTDPLHVELREPEEFRRRSSSSGLKRLQWSIHAGSVQQQAQPHG